jgi:hypothetical protein
VPQPGQLGTLALSGCVGAGIPRATPGIMSNVPHPGQPGAPSPAPSSQPGVQPIHAPVDPDPKAHPIHPTIPTQPIHEGGDPSVPVTGDDRIR